MSDKIKYIIYSLMDFAFTFGGTGAVIVLHYIDKDTTIGYKLTLTGIILECALIFTAKYAFEKNYRQRYDTLLQQLAEANDMEVKQAISKKIESHKKTNYIYQRLMCLLPFAIVYVITWLGAKSLESLGSTVGLILASMGAGSIFNIAKKPVGEKVSLQKMTRKAHRADK